MRFNTERMPAREHFDLGSHWVPLLFQISVRCSLCVLY
ncbi:hypothetical protein DLM_0114 [Aquitalea magnusonii]|uniref:Uncharacterized protein n=1 Tax=Aquitalea magnusonii TaxID=332411 RepID=A0A3G9G6V3_9NEIS|nr:hypothetical protein DLM_0114 [Aquitalea magnusonii]